MPTGALPSAWDAAPVHLAPARSAGNVWHSRGFASSPRAPGRVPSTGCRVPGALWAWRGAVAVGVRVLLIPKDRIRSELAPQREQALPVDVVSRGLTRFGWLTLMPVVAAQRQIGRRLEE